MAVDYINRDSSILGDYQLDLLVEDTECKVDVTMKHFLHYAVDGEHTVAGILGKSLCIIILIFAGTASVYEFMCCASKTEHLHG